MNSNEAIQKLKQDANLSEHASFTKIRKKNRWELERNVFLCNISVLIKLDLRKKKSQRIHFKQLYRHAVKVSLK